MKLSIITINYNNKAGLEKTIASVMSQTWRDFEWILIDGGSTDGSADVIAELAEKPEANISYWCSEPDGGIYLALNKGVKFAEGEYVNFMNAGDAFVDEHVLENVFSEDQMADVLYGNAYFCNSNSRWLKTYPECLSFNWLCTDTLNHQSTFTHRKVFHSISFDNKYVVVADRKFWMECVLFGFSFKYLRIDIALYDSNGYSSQNLSSWDRDHKAIYNELVSKVLQIDLERSNALNYYIEDPYINIAARIIHLGGKISYLFKILTKMYFKLSNFYRK